MICKEQQTRMVGGEKLAEEAGAELAIPELESRAPGSSLK